MWVTKPQGLWNHVFLELSFQLILMLLKRENIFLGKLHRTFWQVGLMHAKGDLENDVFEGCDHELDMFFT